MVHVGIGYDVHRLVEDRKLILGGVDIPHLKGLDGHSDADVLMHAICDAVLGALGVPVQRVGIKATTNEHLGFLGREEGIAAMAVASVEAPE